MSSNRERRSTFFAARRAWHTDRGRYGPRAWFREPSLVAVAWLRAGQATCGLGGPVGRIVGLVYWLGFRILEVVLGVSITRNTVVGSGLRIHHFGGIFVNERSVIGAGCTLRQGVTIGSRTPGGRAPVLEDRVDVGAYAQILGGVTVGRGATIGAMAVVVHDVASGTSVVGNPARPTGSPSSAEAT